MARASYGLTNLCHEIKRPPVATTSDGDAIGPMSVSSRYPASVLSIPVHPNVTDSGRAYVCETINGVI